MRVPEQVGERPVAPDFNPAARARSLPRRLARLIAPLPRTMLMVERRLGPAARDAVGFHGSLR